jgi:pimeloyl-ACP methyl ester carboxylesterase
MTEQFCSVGDVELCYETFGAPEDPALLLIMGLGTQMIAWPDEFCAQLAGDGFFVIRFDNRDIGRSTHLNHIPVPTMRELLLRRPAQYSLSDMAADAIGLLDHLGIDRAHVVGASMGGMIAQVLTIEHPERVLSLASIMSNTGGRFTGQPSLRVQPLILRGPPSDPAAAEQRVLRLFEMVGSPGFPRDNERLLSIVRRSRERGGAPGGVARQLAAIVSSPNRVAQLGWVRVPTVVIHGSADRLVNPSGGRATARAIRDAHLVVVEGMGHDLPQGAWPQVIDALEENARRATLSESTPAATAPAR